MTPEPSSGRPSELLLHKFASVVDVCTRQELGQQQDGRPRRHPSLISTVIVHDTKYPQGWSTAVVDEEHLTALIAQMTLAEKVAQVLFPLARAYPGNVVPTGEEGLGGAACPEFPDDVS